MAVESWPSRPTDASKRVMCLTKAPAPSGPCLAAAASTQPTPTSAIAYSDAAMTSTSRIAIDSFQGRAMPRNAQNIQRQFESATGITTTTQSATCQRPTLRPRARRGKVQRCNTTALKVSSKTSSSFPCSFGLSQSRSPLLVHSMPAPVRYSSTSAMVTSRATNSFGGGMRTRSWASFDSIRRSVATIAPSAIDVASRWPNTSIR